LGSQQSTSIPKMHQLIHFHEQMLRYVILNLCIHKIFRFGPLRLTWCMRFEGKNKEIKSYVNNCFRNVPFIDSECTTSTLSVCYHLANDNFLYPGDEVLGGKPRELCLLLKRCLGSC
jgi:hypothetical protein